MENNLNNLPPFYIGQKVIYITGTNMPKDSIHTVSGLHKSDCGCYVIQINGQPPKVEIGDISNPNWKCKQCGKQYKKTNENCFRRWLASSFRPLQEETFPLIELSKVIEKEKQLVSSN